MLDKAIEYSKEYREQYRGAKACDKNCRNCDKNCRNQRYVRLS